MFSDEVGSETGPGGEVSIIDSIDEGRFGRLRHKSDMSAGGRW